ncbi:OmpA family protein [Pseudomonas sp. NPDC007930]|uniref:OmpA family protein n=1 Tax=Pseudomonas sp. NPDC007930 TaxID=3364417 RepID=UPI0036EB9B48
MTRGALIGAAPDRPGGDPRALPAFAQLRQELAKLDHPARPDVDWARVQQCCLALWRDNGAELHSVAAWALAQAHREGVPGAAAAMAWLGPWLVDQWGRLWPPADGERLAILEGLCRQLLPWLRGANARAAELPALHRLAAELRHLEQWLHSRAQAQLPALGQLRQVLGQLSGALERQPAAMPAPLLEPWPAAALPPSHRPAPLALWLGPPPRRRARWPWWAAAGVLCLAASAALGWAWLRPAPLPPPPAPLQLPALALFKPGSAEFSHQAPAQLIATLGQIKAHPGWQVVLEGHSDASGDALQNQQLSLARAHAVQAWLQRMGPLPAQCFSASGAGASRPLAVNDAAAGRALNRRVEVRLVAVVPRCDVLNEREGNG